ncbi:MAG: ImmA/IrrE family metallo-endopeptidase [Candidatus Aegiribacteria sp.]|nr:ImmA/IrrE family metallo-endopeptidase [Candidatus Aegiribacteria sp.]
MNNVDRLIRQGNRIRKIRAELGYSPENVANLLGFSSRQSVYDLEKGKRDLKAFEALKLADYFGITPEELVTGETIVTVPVSWRGEPDRHAENTLKTRLARYIRLEEFTGKVSESAMPSYSLTGDNTFESIAATAESVAGALNLGEYPARILAETIRKKWNVIVFNVPLNSGSAACIRERGISAVLLNSNDAWWRRNFSLGHELFHLLFLDTANVPETRIEQLANIFASNLLMPINTIDTDVRRLVEDKSIQYFDLMQLAREYMVSTEALLWRMYSLEIITKDVIDKFQSNSDLKSLDREVHGSLARVELELPPDLVFLAYKVYLQGKISVGKLAEYLETTVGLLKKILISYGIEPFAKFYEASISNS